MTRRSESERAAEMEIRARELRAQADRRLSIASDPMCALLWEAETAIRKLASYGGSEGKEVYAPMANALAEDRAQRWAGIKEKNK